MAGYQHNAPFMTIPFLSPLLSFALLSSSTFLQRSSGTRAPLYSVQGVQNARWVIPFRHGDKFLFAFPTSRLSARWKRFLGENRHRRYFLFLSHVASQSVRRKTDNASTRFSQNRASHALLNVVVPLKSARSRRNVFRKHVSNSTMMLDERQ